MRLARYRRLVGKIVYFNNNTRTGQRMLQLGIRGGVITAVERTRQIILFEINCRYGEERRIIRLSRYAFTFHSPNGRDRLEQLIGLPIYFNVTDEHGGEMIDGGTRDGIVHGVTRSQDGTLLYEICFGPGGQKKFSLFQRSAFAFHPPAPAQTKTESGATKG